MCRQIALALVLSGLCLAGADEAGAANLYRWKDSNGNTVMSDRPPPPGVEFETISTRSSLVQRVDEDEPAAEAAPVAAPATPVQAKPEPEPEPEPAKSVYKKNPEYCKNARTNLEILERPRIRVTGDDGETRFLTEEERETERQKAQEIIAEHCE